MIASKTPSESTVSSGQVSEYTDILAFFRKQELYVVSFAGFGELGYRDTSAVQNIAEKILARMSPDNTLVQCGTLCREGGLDGIADVHALARNLGFNTVGIHASIALEFADTHTVSPFEQHTFFVSDNSWGGYIDDDRTLSPTLKLILGVSDELVVIGGGHHAAQELDAFLRFGKSACYFPAEMNQEASIRWRNASGIDVGDVRGAARVVWENHTGGN